MIGQIISVDSTRHHIIELADHFPDAWERRVVIVDGQGQPVQSIGAG